MKTFSSAVLEPRSYGAETMENNVHDWQTSYCSIKHGTQEERDPSHFWAWSAPTTVQSNEGKQHGM